MLDTKHKPAANSPHSVHVLTEEYQKTYLDNTLDRFLDEYVFVEDEESKAIDGIWCYGTNILKSFLLLADIRDAVASGNGEDLSAPRKQLLEHFFATPGFAIEMFVNILQCQVVLSEAEAHICKWAATVC